MRTFRIVDFLTAKAVAVHPLIERREQYPFTLLAAKRFFDHFLNESFQIDAVVRSILVFDGKVNLPQHSYAACWLFAEAPDQLEQYKDVHGKLPPTVGLLHLEFGGTLIGPSVTARLLSE